MDDFQWHDPAILQHFALVLAALTALITFWKRAQVTKWITIAWRKSFGATHYLILTEMRELKANQALFQTEMHPNGGGSIKDQLNRIEEQGHDTYALTGAKLQVDSQAMFVTDEHGKVTSNNYEHQMLTGFSTDQVSQDQWILVIAPEDRDMVGRKWQEAVDQERPFSEDIWYVTPKGRRYKVHVKASRQLDKNGKLRGWLGVVTPLDEYGRKICAFHHERCEETLLSLKETHAREAGELT
jgi:PAS domain S-box-containing protein